jgi:hypothetical protein
MTTKIKIKNKIKKKKKDLEDGVVKFPKNMFKKNSGNVFIDEVEEDHAWEQFFWTRETVDNLMKACNMVYVEETCCFTTPSLAHGWHEQGRDEVLLDIDKRFEYLPKFKYYDARDPKKLDNDFRLIILDPPFFVVPIKQFRKAVDVITNKNYNTKIIIGFLKREEKLLLDAFNDYRIYPTKFELQYSSIKPSKWKNFTLYSNIDLPGIKRLI